MPHLIECLTNVEEYAGAVLFCFEGCVDGMAESMDLLYSGVFSSKTELVVRYILSIPDVGGYSVGK